MINLVSHIKFVVVVVVVVVVIPVSDLEVPQDGCDEVDADAFWDQVCLSMVFRGFLHSGMLPVHYFDIGVCLAGFSFCFSLSLNKPHMSS